MITYIITYKLEKQKERRAVNQKCSHKGATPKVCNASRKIDATKICFQPTCWKHDIYIYIYIYICQKSQCNTSSHFKRHDHGFNNDGKIIIIEQLRNTCTT